jgi:hypothetical protein
MPVMLDVAIGLVFTYLLLSLLCTAINEWIASFGRMRANILVKAIARLVDPMASGESLSSADRILQQPEVRALSPAIDKPPSYLPRAVFVRAATQAKVAPERSDEDWGLLFDASMDRATGWFKRKMQVISVIVAIVLTLFANADTLHVVNALWRSPTLRAQVVVAAQRRVADESTQRYFGTYRDLDHPTLSEPDSGLDSAERESEQPPPTPTPEEQELLAGMIGWRTDFAQFNAAVAESYLAERERVCSAPASDSLCQALLARIAQDRRVRLEGSTIVPTDAFPGSAFFSLRLLALALLHLPGWLFTVAAITVGAPFWFDLLSRFVNLRGTGRPPEQNPVNRAAR